MSQINKQASKQKKKNKSNKNLINKLKELVNQLVILPQIHFQIKKYYNQKTKKLFLLQIITQAKCTLVTNCIMNFQIVKIENKNELNQQKNKEIEKKKIEREQKIKNEKQIKQKANIQQRYLYCFKSIYQFQKYYNSKQINCIYVRSNFKFERFVQFYKAKTKIDAP
ncbi:hypothetical protein TTHERM_000592722 (macronuclear) [Tetrahymena thermophila SB210]|uniref:Uncharacterized protein n=1 Tax=Tetrahymena thermophila (strain SB210) TaxID=312017 RepID=W7XDE9_TETTS|nr:hypothetical protein TTHERM_000592722 [Tetrahymena thermophila SB210]EWS75567.1 hypothetical protein TTHERM_000592722 [Tetrahymena thermophila SB210]|eukprot:XP_012651867.1 hypothetical protein TTHERM_000592722 [Tetrahymena thermophila SB210]